MKLKKLIISCALILSVLSCKKKDTGLIKLYIDNTSIEEVINIDSMVNSIDVIPLETNGQKSILSDVAAKIIFYEGKIYIIDYLLDHYIAIFDSNGRFVHKIKVTGQGPGEITDIRSTVLNKTTNQLEVFSASEKKLVRFSPNGDFISESQEKYYYQDKVANLDGTSIYYSSDLANIGSFGGEICYELFMISSEGKLIPFKQFNRQEFEGRIGVKTPNPFFLNKYSTYFSKIFSDTIFSVSPRGLIPEFVIDFKKNPVNSKFWAKNTRYVSKLDAVNKENAAYFLGNLFVNNKLICAPYSFNGSTSYWFIYDRLNKKKLVNSEFVQVQKYGLTLPTPTHFTEDSFIYYYPARAFKQMVISRSVNDKLPQKFKDIAKNLKPEDNPVIIKIKLKN